MIRAKVLLQGNEACVQGALAVGMRFFAGYPITPSTEIAEGSAQLLPAAGGTFIQMEDEIAAMAAVVGASAMGVKSMTATSGPGFSLKQENIGYAAFAEIPCVIVNVQRYGPSTGLPTCPSQGDVMQARWGTHGDHPIIAISPSTVGETYELIVRCFNLSEKYRTPVIFLMDEIVGHLREGVDIPAPGTYEVIDRRTAANDRSDAEPQTLAPYEAPANEYVPVAPPLGQGVRYNITGLVHDEWGFPTNSNEVAGALCTRLMNKIEKNLDDIITFETKYLADADIAVFCYGGTARSALAAIETLRKNGVKIGMFRPITIWPFPAEKLAEASAHIKHILVVEHNYGQLLHEVKGAVCKNSCSVHFLGNVEGTVITPDQIIAAVIKIPGDDANAE